MQGKSWAASLEEIQSNLDSLLTDELDRITKVFEHTEKRFTKLGKELGVSMQDPSQANKNTSKESKSHAGKKK